MFETQEAGDGDSSIAQESSGLLQSFVDHIKRQKVVVLEELAAEFGMNQQDAVSRVRSLIEMGRLTGVIDDRGALLHRAPEYL